LCNVLRQRVILHGQGNVAAEQVERVEFAVFVKRVSGAAAQAHDSGQTASGFQRRKALEQFRRDVAVGTEEHGVRRRVENNGTARRRERVHMFGEERNEGGIGHQGESLSRRGGQHGGLVVEEKERTFARALAEGKTAPVYHALTRPPLAEAEAVHRAIALAEIAGAPVYIVHLSSEDALNQVREARDRGVPVFAETCPQYLLLSIDELARPGFEGAKYVFTPPLRPKEHQPKLWEGLRHDHLQVVSADHCPFCFADQKILGKDDFTKIPNGGPGIENRLQLIYHHGVNSGKLSLNRFVELTSTTPARLFGMYPKKGEIAPGSDADLVLWDPHAAHTISAATHHMRVDYSMFEGFQVRGNARTVISRGEVIVDGDRFLGKPGRGNYLKRAARGGAWK